MPLHHVIVVQLLVIFQSVSSKNHSPTKTLITPIYEYHGTIFDSKISDA